MYTNPTAPWGLMERLHRDVDRLLGAQLRAEQAPAPAEPGGWRPAVDVREEDARFVIRADVPGVNPDDLEVTMENGQLSIRGRRSTRADTERDGWRRVERAGGRFQRRVTLPESADAERIQAQCSNGVLEIAVPKQPRRLPRRIRVKAG